MSAADFIESAAAFDSLRHLFRIDAGTIVFDVELAPFCRRAAVDLHPPTRVARGVLDERTHQLEQIFRGDRNRDGIGDGDFEHQLRTELRALDDADDGFDQR